MRRRFLVVHRRCRYRARRAATEKDWLGVSGARGEPIGRSNMRGLNAGPHAASMHRAAGSVRGWRWDVRRPSVVYRTAAAARREQWEEFSAGGVACTSVKAKSERPIDANGDRGLRVHAGAAVYLSRIPCRSCTQD
jgi:hypothetical protein